MGPYASENFKTLLLLQFYNLLQLLLQTPDSGPNKMFFLEFWILLGVINDLIFTL